MTRTTHEYDQGIVVFLIGMQFTQPWRVDQWAPVFLAMPKMLRELYAEKAAFDEGAGPDPGFMGHRMLLGAGGPTLIQYWRTESQLMGYARDAGHTHRPAWKAFNSRARRAPGAVGIWHEVYDVPAGSHHSVYGGSMKPIGLAVVTAATDAYPEWQA